MMNRRSIDVLVISDIHLGTYGCKARELVNYLKYVSPNILIINGDSWTAGNSRGVLSGKLRVIVIES